MATMPIYNMTDLWNSGGTTYDAIKMNVTDSASSASSRLMTLQVGSTDKSYITKAGLGYFAGGLWLAAATALTFGSSDVAVTHSTDLLAFSGAASGYTFDKKAVVGHTANLSIGGNADNLEIFGTDAATGGVAIGMFSATAGTGPHLDFYRSKDGTMATATVVASGDLLGAVNAYGAQQTGTFATQTMAAQIRFEVDGTVTSGSSGDMPGRIVFATTADGGSAVTSWLILDAAGVLKPNANDGVALGTTALSYADLFLASGAVINYANSDYTLTHSSGTLTASGALTVLGAFTSRGVDDNATGERLQIADTLINFGPSSTANYYLGRVLDTGSLTLGASSAASATGDAQLTLYGASHASQAGDIVLTSNGAGGSPGLTLDISAQLLTLAGGGGNVYLQDATRIGQNTTNSPGSGNNTVGAGINTSGQAFFSASITPLTLNVTSDGILAGFRSGSTQQGTISVSGTTITYGTFNGSHEAQLVDGVDRSKLLCGTIIDSVDEQSNWYGYPDRVLPKVKISDKAGSKRVYGVFFDWYGSDPEDDTVNNSSLGAYVIRIAKGETVEGGDLIESNGDGCGRVQADDIFRASTVAKITSTVVAKTYADGSYLLPCTLHCG